VLQLLWYPAHKRTENTEDPAAVILSKSNPPLHVGGFSV
jgi:hypothetical protein